MDTQKTRPVRSYASAKVRSPYRSRSVHSSSTPFMSAPVRAQCSTRLGGDASEKNLSFSATSGNLDTSSRSSESVCVPTMPATMAPAEDPTTILGSRFCRSSVLTMPMWKQPMAAPPLSTSADRPMASCVSFSSTSLSWGPNSGYSWSVRYLSTRRTSWMYCLAPLGRPTLLVHRCCRAFFSPCKQLMSPARRADIMSSTSPAHPPATARPCIFSRSARPYARSVSSSNASWSLLHDALGPSFASFAACSMWSSSAAAFFQSR
mmetsp:Transcript_38344/g.73469  ORF Transcript_38344/g.73469 Transcript_38344/m.73469 type:complete len:263 (+) Transcript_38344:1066-1854(+)